MRTGPLFREFPEFPIPEFDCKVFGFSADLSNSAYPAGCPCFGTPDGRYRLWWNWPNPAERELYLPMTRWFVTRHDSLSGQDRFLDPAYRPQDDDALLFATESPTALVCHFLEHPYVQDRPLLDAPVTDEFAVEFYRALRAAGIYFHPADDPADAFLHGNTPLTESAIAALRAYNDALTNHYGARLADFAVAVLQNGEGLRRRA